LPRFVNIALSGTPIINKPVEFFNVLNILRPSIFNSFYKFTNRYCAPSYNGFGWNYNGASNLDELHKILLDTCMIRRLKKDVLKELPDKVISILPVNSFSKELKQEYQTAVDDMIITIKNEKGEKQNIELLNVLHQIEVLKQLAFKMKFDSIVEWVEDFLESGKKLVIFCNHHFAIDELMKKFPDISVKLDGRDNIENRNTSVKEFMNNDKIRLFVGNIKAAGEGITLTVSDTCLIVEFPWTPGEISQAFDRLHRIGQKESVNCYYMIASGTIEEDIVDLLDEKRKILDKALDGIETEQNNLIRELMKRFKEQ
jgi:SWI/SNF-related matrix-associated actin-dependent regulator 1 of chromatin subfamily A